MLFSEIKPFVRYAQKFTLGEDASYVSVCPCDNRLFFCEDGATDIETEKAVYRLAKGDVIILPAGSMYKIIAPKDKATLVGVNFDYTFARADIRYPVSPIPVLNFCLRDVIERVSFSDVVELNDVLYLQKTHFKKEKYGER